jgi:hypothetical protein
MDEDMEGAKGCMIGAGAGVAGLAGVVGLWLLAYGFAFFTATSFIHMQWSNISHHNHSILSIFELGCANCNCKSWSTCYIA